MDRPTRLVISGATGRMGQALQALLRADVRWNCVAAPRRAGDWSAVAPADVVIDFSVPAGFEAALAYCRAQHVAFVSGTTGLDGGQWSAMRAVAADIPVLHAANFSLGIAVLTQAVELAAAALPEWDLEIVEAHHARKVDAPSGTALALGRVAAAARGEDFNTVAVLSREGNIGTRQKGTIGFAAIRAGDIVGEHTVVLGGAGERIELTHRATDRSIFARGALIAAAWLPGKPPALYSIADVIRARTPRPQN
ncbi:MAG TPA: 4-hydroxy-tetrahydrodipicolinate reductase [Rhodanobacteraceae bacterium]|nr:4-hydroxy-tetrahydrodipicolinate reductase [Rhodanobacteraceae bacterium]